MSEEESKEQESSIRLPESARLASPETQATEELRTFEEIDPSSNESVPKRSGEEGKGNATLSFRKIPETFPRSCACIGGIFLPLFFLIAIALIGGKFVAEFEAPQEYSTNDSVLANYNTILLTDSIFNRTVELLLQLPENCLAQYLQSITYGETNLTYCDIIQDSNLLDDGLDAVELSLLGQIPGLREYMTDCGGLAESLVETLLEIQDQTSFQLASQALTFDWIRCWDEDEHGQHLSFRATPQLLTAASQQSEFYTETWERDQQRLQREYAMELGRNATGIERLEATILSIADATGRGGCSENIAGSAWFFFTVMTTIGYGNQAPETTGGRALVASLGYLCIFVFGTVSAAASKILTVVIDDLMERWHLNIVKRPVVGVMLWGTIAILGTFFFANQSFRWWNTRLPDDEQPYADWWESAWFAYITTTTVGLGDFYLQPDYIFVQDIFSFAMICLLCFVCFAALIGKFGELLGNIFPDSMENLEHRIARTNYTNMEVMEATPKETDLIKLLRGLAKEDQHLTPGDPISLTMIRQEEKLLLEALDKRKKEIERAEESSSGDVA